MESEITTPGETPIKPPSKLRRNLLLILLLAVIIIAVVVVIIHRKQQKAPLYTIVPENCAIIVAADSNWWWNIVDDISQEPKAREAMAKAEKELGIVFKRDLASWTDEVGIAFFGMELTTPKLVLYAGIKDKDKFADAIKRIDAVVEKESKAKWSEYKYHNISLRKIDIPDPGSMPVRVTAGVVGKWLIVGVGAGTIEKAVDAALGRTPSLAKNEAWKEAFMGLPQKPVAWLGIDGQQFVKSMPANNPMMPMDLSKLYGYVAVGAVTEKSDEIRIDSNAVYTSDLMINMYKEVKSKSKPITGKSLAQMPKGTIAAMLISAPGVWFEQYKMAMLSTMTDPGTRSTIQQQLVQIKPIEDAIKRCTGECGLAFAYREGHGFGVVVVGETEGASKALDAAVGLQQFVQSFHQPVSRQGSVFKLDSQTYPSPFFPILPCWYATGPWLGLSTHPYWISSSTPKTDMKIPDEARGADMMFIGSLEFISPLLKQMEKQMTTKDQREVIEFARKLKLDNAQLISWGTIDPDGKKSHSTAILRGWEWRKAVQTIVEFAAAH